MHAHMHVYIHCVCVCVCVCVRAYVCVCARMCACAHTHTHTHTHTHKLQALVFDILPSTTAIFSYDTGSRKLSANEQFFVGAQTVVSLL